MTNFDTKALYGCGERQRVFDPFLEYCCSTYEITKTGVAFVDDHAYLDERSRGFIHAAASLGFVSGLGIPMRLRGGPRCGGFNLGTSLDRASFEETVWPHAETLRAVCLIAHRRIEEVARQDDPAPAARSLSPREL